jgi:hypothetical protein
MEVFNDNWSNINDLVQDFMDVSVLDFDIVYASYATDSYEGDSYVLARKDGQLYENEASHCSCYGLEGLWFPTPVTVDYLLQRLEKGYSKLPFTAEQIEALR